MKIVEGGGISEGSTYEIEFTKAEEVAEFGEYARKLKFSLPSTFDSNNEDIKAITFNKALEIMTEKDFDTFVITQTTFREFVFYKAVGE